MEHIFNYKSITLIIPFELGVDGVQIDMDKLRRFLDEMFETLNVKVIYKRKKGN